MRQCGAHSTCARDYHHLTRDVGPRSHPCHGLLGQVYANQGDNQRAIEEFKIGISSDDDGSLHYLLGRLYQKTGKKELADAAFKDSRRIANNR